MKGDFLKKSPRGSKVVAIDEIEIAGPNPLFFEIGTVDVELGGDSPYTYLGIGQGSETMRAWANYDKHGALEKVQLGFYGSMEIQQLIEGFKFWLEKLENLKPYEPQTSMPVLYTPNEVQEILKKKNVRTVYRYINSGKLKAKRIQNRLYIEEDVLNGFLDLKQREKHGRKKNVRKDDCIK